MRKNLLITFLFFYSAGATLANEEICQGLQPCLIVKSILDHHHEEMRIRREAFSGYLQRIQQAKQLGH